MICGICNGQVENCDDIVAHPSNGRVAHELCYRNLARACAPIEIGQNSVPAEEETMGQARNRLENGAVSDGGT